MPPNTVQSEFPPADQWRPPIHQHLRVLQIITLGMAAGSTTLLGIVIVIRAFISQPGTVQVAWIPWAVVPVAIVGVVAAHLWEQHFIRRNLILISQKRWSFTRFPSGSQFKDDLSLLMDQFGDIGRLYAVFFVTRLARGAIYEGLACLTCVGYLLTPHFVLLLLAAGLIGGILGGLPTMESVAAWISDSLGQIERHRAQNFPR